MDQQEKPSALTRRGFLKASSLVAGAAVLPGLGVFARPAQAQPLSSGVSARVGLVLAGSNVHASLDQNLAAGMRLGFQTSAQAGGPAIDLVTAHTGVNPAAAIDQAQKLVTEDHVDLLVGVAAANMAAQIHPLLEKNRTFLIGVDAGANIARLSEQSRYIFSNSLGYWRANWAVGQWAAQHLGRRVCIATSLYESGYDSLHAFQLGFESAGGKVAETCVTHVPPSEFNAESLSAAISPARPDFVYALYSGPQAMEFLRAYVASGLVGRVPLAASPFMVDESLLAAHGRAALGIKSVSTWAPGLQNPANQAFTAAYQAATGRAPDAFALLGYETAQLVAAAVQAVGGETSRTDQFRQALAAVRFSGPRGSFKMDAATHSITTPLYLREVRDSGSGLYNEVIATLDPVNELDPRLQPLRSSQRTGWTHAYLSV